MTGSCATAGAAPAPLAAGAGLTLILLLTVAVTAPRLLAGRDRSAVGAGGQARPGRLVRVAMEPWWACVWTAGAWSCAFPVAPGRAGRALRTGL